MKRVWAWARVPTQGGAACTWERLESRSGLSSYGFIYGNAATWLGDENSALTAVSDAWDTHLFLGLKCLC